MAVTRCVCFRTTFRALREQADAAGWRSLADLAAATGCGTGCGGCRPYLAAMLASGATCFAVTAPGQRPRPCPPDPWDRDR